ncbi:hypothetical protein IGI37_003258 [Enterococcus sp. AZ194]
MIGHWIINSEIEVVTPLRFGTRRNYHIYQVGAYTLLAVSVISIFLGLFVINSLMIGWPDDLSGILLMLNFID